MCEPMTVLAVGSMVVGGAMQAQAQKQQAEAQADALRFQAEMDRMKGADAQARGAIEAGRTRTAASLAIGEDKAQLAAGGVDTTSGSPLAALIDKRAASELDVATIQNNAAREAWGYGVDASMKEQQARNAIEQGNRAAMGTFFGTAGQVAGAGYRGYRGNAPAGGGSTTNTTIGN